jgi:hypothetical protein
VIGGQVGQDLMGFISSTPCSVRLCFALPIQQSNLS